MKNIGEIVNQKVVWKCLCKQRNLIFFVICHDLCDKNYSKLFDILYDNQIIITGSSFDGISNQNPFFQKTYHIFNFDNFSFCQDTSFFIQHTLNSKQF